MRKGGSEAVQRWTAKNVQPRATQTQTWVGKTRDRDAARSGAYLFRVREKGGALAERSTASAAAKAEGDRSFGYFDHASRSGQALRSARAPARARAGRTCRPGLRRALEGPPSRQGAVGIAGGRGAGYYVVIDGKSTRRDYVYMHLKAGADRRGDRVKTGQRVGEVGGPATPPAAICISSSGPSPAGTRAATSSGR